ncbi:anthocyanidin 3-O-glucosyltransferase 5 [Lactuca sativa]|uniref:anthocyanidin 3-O-glucosyltransferase 5 n=1 Tax=Lactuca sativa TaxID=4236 RepID=UPI000CD97DBE|nr:anthocyanidin 3-O-glucosyltransferase 5 [Lactuca sativa]
MFQILGPNNAFFNVYLFIHDKYRTPLENALIISVHLSFVSMSPKKLHAAILCSPGVGHLVPVLLLGRRLINHHNLHVTVLAVTTTTSTAESQLLNSLTADIHLPVIQIPAADISSIVSPDAKVVTKICAMMRETIPTIRTTISSMDPLPDILIGDIFSTESWTIAEEIGMAKYVFITSNAWFTGLVTYSPVLDKEVVGQYVDQTEPFKIPDCKPVRPEDVVDPMLDRDDEDYRVYLNLAVGVTLADGILINTWENLEPQSLHALRNNEILRSIVKNKPVYTVGPITKNYEPVGVKSEVIEWLDKQPERSVIYVSFGSGGTLSAEQITELAWGLELSQQRFVWVVRPPAGHIKDGSFFESGHSGELNGQADYLPEGFLNRTKKKGFVVHSWAPQVEILNHVSVLGFMTHCGWNSTLESISSGVAMIAWALYAEQRMNATMLTEELKVAVRPEVLPTKKVVGREEVEKMVRCLIDGEEGKAMTEKVKRLKESAEEALSVNGSSYISSCKFVEDCWSRVHLSR